MNCPQSFTHCEHYVIFSVLVPFVWIMPLLYPWAYYTKVHKHATHYLSKPMAQSSQPSPPWYRLARLSITTDSKGIYNMAIRSRDFLDWYRGSASCDARRSRTNSTACSLNLGVLQSDMITNVQNITKMIKDIVHPSLPVKNSTLMQECIDAGVHWCRSAIKFLLTIDVMNSVSTYILLTKLVYMPKLRMWTNFPFTG